MNIILRRILCKKVYNIKQKIYSSIYADMQIKQIFKNHDDIFLYILSKMVYIKLEFANCQNKYILQENLNQLNIE